MMIGGIEIIFFLYIFANIYVAGTSLIMGHLPKDSPFPNFSFDSETMILNLTLVIFSYLAILFWYSQIKGRCGVSENKVKDEVSIGLFSLICQLILLYYIVAKGVMTAGHAPKEGLGYFGYFSLLFVPDYLFLVYYSVSKKSLLSASNVIVYLFSTIIRGWGGGVLMIFFFKVLQYCKKKYFSYIIVILLSGMLIGPFFYQIRTTVRSHGKFDFSMTEDLLSETFSKAYFSSSSDDVMLSFFSMLFNRFSHLTSPVMILSNLDLFLFGVQDGKFAPSFSEGKIQGYVTRHRFVGMPVLAKYICAMFLPTPYGTWFIHPGMVGWFWVNPLHFPLFLAYCAFLIYAGIFLMRKLGAGKNGEKGVFLFVLFFLINGWFVPFTNCLQAMVLFFFLQKILEKMRKNFIIIQSGDNY